MSLLDDMLSMWAGGGNAGGGLPANVLAYMKAAPSFSETESRPGPAYAGQQQEEMQGLWGQRDDALNNQLWGMRLNRQQNIPQWEGNPLGQGDNTGLRRLPNGQYVPSGVMYPFDYWQNRGNPNSFYWNPQPLGLLEPMRGW